MNEFRINKITGRTLNMVVIRGLVIFAVGFILSFIVGSLTADGGFAAMTAVCYVGAILASKERT